MNDDPYRRVLQALRDHGSKVTEHGVKADAQCPAHDDRIESLSVSRGDRQPVVLRCQRGESCHPDDILGAIGLTMGDLCAPREERGPDLWMPCGHTKVAEYAYRTADGRLVFAVARCDRKGIDCQGFRQWRPDPAKRSGKTWTRRLPDGTRAGDGLPYRLPEVLHSGGPVWVVEGEKDADRLWALGVPATCNAEGAGKWTNQHAEWLRGRDVRIVADRDESGDAHAEKVGRTLDGVARSIGIVQSLTDGKGADISDHLDAGYALADVVHVQRFGDYLDGQAAVADTDRPHDQGPQGHDELVALELERLRVRRDATHLLKAEERPEAEEAEWLPLDQLLALPPQEITWRIYDWMPTDARIVLAAQRKAGKTTAVGNLVRSLIDGDSWLGNHTVNPLDGNVILFDFEMSQSKLTEWLRDQKIGDPRRLIVVPLRGKGGGFDILDDRTRAQWARRIRDAGGGYVVLDCLRPVMDALALDEDKQAGRFLTAFDALLNEAAVLEAAVIHHMGHNGERSRGDSRLRDWPDVEWKIVRQDPDDDASPRFISAYGRDVDQREQQLGYDPQARRLISLGGTRKEAGAAAVIPYVIDLLKKRPELTSVRKGWFESTAVEVDGDEAPGRDQVRAAVRLAAQQGLLTESLGPRNSKLYRLSISAAR